MADSVVVFPAPFGPTSATTSPSSHEERDPVQRRDAAVVHAEVIDRQHRPPSCRRYAVSTAGSVRTSRRRPDADRLAVVEHLDPLAEPHDHAHVVLDHDQRAAEVVPDQRQRLDELVALPLVQAGGRLVQEQELSASPRVREACRAGARARAASPVASASARSASPSRSSSSVRHAARPTVRIPTPTPPSSTFSSTVSPGNSRTDWNVRARPRRASWCGLQPVTSLPSRNTPRRRLLEPGKRVDERRLAGAVRPDQTEDLALGGARDRHRRRHGPRRSGPSARGPQGGHHRSLNPHDRTSTGGRQPASADPTRSLGRRDRSLLWIHPSVSVAASTSSPNPADQFDGSIPPRRRYLPPQRSYTPSVCRLLRRRPALRAFRRATGQEGRDHLG